MNDEPEPLAGDERHDTNDIQRDRDRDEHDARQRALLEEQLRRQREAMGFG